MRQPNHMAGVMNIGRTSWWCYWVYLMCGSSRNGALHKLLNPHARFISSIRDYQVASAIINHIKKIIKPKNDLIQNKVI